MTRNIHLAGNHWEKYPCPPPTYTLATALPLKEDTT